ncbi:zona pellucida sperm-binding protein 3 receptor-like isoform X2 [Rhinatrema bivittatum]|uniref:zona pellucida sperm-binding protein 3 receptor-like isoform X2 n=1 Tax=Rhinatrema bivittatum TaxID=194408 RepID=UPI00112DF3F0|nr:zona pellucida sperm-binding protein 3 receptor-like isoform X2 [Rhinatrema bivittatum]
MAGCWLSQSAFMFRVMLAGALIPAARSDCGAAPHSPYAVPQERYFDFTSFPEGSIVAYECRPGYSKIHGLSNRIECGAASEWTIIPQFCERRSCGSPGELMNGYVQLDDALFGSTAKFACDKGYRMVGKSERKCLHSGSWSNVVPMCDPVICENPAEIADGTHSGKGKDEFTYQSSVTYRCNGPSLSLIGEPSIFCTENGTWSANPPTCKDIRCPFPEIKDGQVTSRIQPYYRLGEQITFRCNFAFIINGSNQVACGTDDNWLPRHPECLKRVSCPEPEIKNGNITQGVKERFHSGLEVGYSVFSSVSFACHPRYVLVGAKTSKCQKDIRWSPNVPTCKLRSSCPEPEIENGIITHGTKQHFHFEVGYRLHSSVSFACNPGYVLIGQNTSECQQDTRWLPDTPTCKPRESCTEPALEYGQVRRGKSEAFKSGWEIGYEVNASVTLQCNPPHVMEGSGEIVCGSDLKWHPSVPTCVESPTTSPPEGSARECEKVPGGFAGLCEAVEKRAEQFCVGEEPENYKTILEMRKLCLEIQKTAARNEQASKLQCNQRVCRSCAGAASYRLIAGAVKMLPQDLHALRL